MFTGGTLYFRTRFLVSHCLFWCSFAGQSQQIVGVTGRYRKYARSPRVGRVARVYRERDMDQYSNTVKRHGFTRSERCFVLGILRNATCSGFPRNHSSRTLLPRSTVHTYSMLYDPCPIHSTSSFYRICLSVITQQFSSYVRRVSFHQTPRGKVHDMSTRPQAQLFAISR